MQLERLIFKSIIGEIHCFFKGKFLIKMEIQRSKDNDRYIQENICVVAPVLSAVRSNKAFSLMSEELQSYFSGKLREFSQPFKLIKGTTFEHHVWLTLQEIPYGETRTYKWLAEKIKKPLSYRAVGQALGRNPLPLILPCHRIIACNGYIGGFSAGIDIKKLLLRHEFTHI